MEHHIQNQFMIFLYSNPVSSLLDLGLIFFLSLFPYFSDGSLYSTSNGQYDIILGKMNLTTFNITKTVQNGTNQAEELTSIEVDSSGDVIVGG